MGDSRRLRSNTKHFLDVKEEDRLPSRVLPKGIDVLKLLLWRKSREKLDKKQLPTMCPRIRSTFEPVCSRGDGCQTEEDPTQWCVVRQIVERYQQAAIPTRSHGKIKEKCDLLFKVYSTEIKKNIKSDGDKAVKKRETFIAEHLESLFPAYNIDAEQIIKEDKKRSKEKQEEDIMFLRDQMGARVQALACRDVQYDREVRRETKREERKRGREELFSRRKEAEDRRRKESLMGEGTAEVIVVESHINNNNSAEPEEEPYTPVNEKDKPVKNRQKGEKAFVPHNILALTVPEATRQGLTNGQHVSMVASFLRALECNLDNFSISHSTARRQRELVNNELAVDIMVQWVKRVQEKGARIILHYDGKLVEELERGKTKRKKYDRLALLAKTPDLPGQDSEQLLGIPEIVNGKGKQKTRNISS